MKHLKNRDIFLNKLKESINVEPINEALSNDIAWGDSIVGRMFSSIFRLAKLGVDIKRVDNLLARLKMVAERAIVYSNEDVKKEVEIIEKETQEPIIYHTMIVTLQHLKMSIEKKEPNSAQKFKKEFDEQVTKKYEQEDIDKVIEGIDDESTRKFITGVSKGDELSISGDKSTELSATSSQFGEIETDKVEIDPYSIKFSNPDKQSKYDKVYNNRNSHLKDLKEFDLSNPNVDKSDQNRKQILTQVLAAENTLKNILRNRLIDAQQEVKLPENVDKKKQILSEIDKINQAIKLTTTENRNNIYSYVEFITEQDNLPATQDSNLPATQDSKNNLPSIMFGDEKIDIDVIITKIEHRVEIIEGEIKDKVSKIGDESDSKIKSSLDKVAFDPIEVVRIFNDVNRIIVKNQIPSDRSGGKVTNARANSWEKLDGGSIDPRSPSGGPFRNIKLFSKWNDGVLALMKDKNLEPFFNSKTVEVDGDKRIVKYTVTSFINDMLNDNKAFASGTGGSYQKKYLDEHFGIKDAKTGSGISDDKEDNKNKYLKVKNIDLKTSKIYDKKSVRLKIKDKTYYLIGFNNNLLNEATVNRGVANEKDIYIISIGNDRLLSNLNDKYKPEFNDEAKSLYIGVINKDKISEGDDIKISFIKQVGGDEIEKATTENIEGKVSQIDVLVGDDGKTPLTLKLLDDDSMKKHNGRSYSNPKTIQKIREKLV